MEEVVTVKLPVTVLAEIVSCAAGLVDAAQALLNLNSEWSAVERVKVPDTGNPPALTLRTFRFEDRESLVAHLEKSHLDPDVEVVAVLKNGIPRNMKVKVQVQFR